MSKYTYTKYHFRPELDNEYSYNNYYKYYLHNKPKGKKYNLTYHQFHSFLSAVLQEAINELAKDNTVKIPYIGKLKAYKHISKPTKKNGKITGWKPFSFYYNPYVIIVLTNKSSKLKNRNIFKFRVNNSLSKLMTKRLRNEEISLTERTRSNNNLYKLYSNG